MKQLFMCVFLALATWVSAAGTPAKVKLSGNIFTVSGPVGYQFSIVDESDRLVGNYTLSATQMDIDMSAQPMGLYWAVMNGYSIPFEIKMPTKPIPFAGQRCHGFSVADGSKRVFSPGNLQYHKGTATWSFAGNQYAVVGADNSKISTDSYTGLIDLFGLGTGTQPTSTTALAYADLSDWGDNAIGGDAPKTWWAMNLDSFVYVAGIRDHARDFQTLVNIGGVYGNILLPDDWTLPANIWFCRDSNDPTSNTWTIGEWNTMDASGAIFFPMAGYRLGTTVSDVNSWACVWSTREATLLAFCIGEFKSSEADKRNNYNPQRAYGRSVRLWKNYTPVKAMNVWRSTLQEAIDAQSGYIASPTLYDNIVVTEPIVISGKGMMLDLHGYQLINRVKNGPMFILQNGAVLYIHNNGNNSSIVNPITLNASEDMFSIDANSTLYSSKWQSRFDRCSGLYRRFYQG